MKEVVSLIVPAMFLFAGIALIKWRAPIARWNKQNLGQLGKAAVPAARGSKPSTMVFLGTFFLVVGLFALAMAVNG